MKRIILTLMFGMFLISLVSATSIGVFEQGKDVELYQTCNNCTYCNFTSIKYPNSSTILSNIEAIRDGTYFSYSLSGGNNSVVGTYIYCYDCGNNIESLTGCLEYSITKTGTKLEMSESVIYILLTLAILGIFLLSLYFAIVTPYSNRISEKGIVIKVTKTKYIKLALILLSYVLFVWFLNVLIGVSDNFLTLTLYYGFISFLFTILMNLTIPFGIFILVVSFFEIIRDANIQKAINKFGGSK